MSVSNQSSSNSFVRIQQDYKLVTQFKFDNNCMAKPIVFIIGKARTGKSTLLNSIFKTNFVVTNSIQPQTKSSAIQETQQFFVIDVQGYGAGTSSQCYNRLLIVMLLISDVTIINSFEGAINEQQIRRVGSLLEILNKIAPLRKKKCYLFWMIQNFYLSITNKQGSRISQDQYFINCLNSLDSNSEVGLASRKNIRQFYKEKCCGCLPPKQSKNYQENILKIKQQFQMIAKNNQIRSLSMTNNINFLNRYLRNLLKQTNMLTKIQSCTLDLESVVQATLMQLAEQKLFPPSKKQLQHSEIKFFDFYRKYVDIEMKHDTILSIQKYQQTFLNHYQIQSEFENKLLFLQQQTQQSVQFSSNLKFTDPIYLNSKKNSSFDENISKAPRQSFEVSTSNKKLAKRNSEGNLRPISKKNILKYTRHHNNIMFRKDQNQMPKLTSIPKRTLFDFNKQNIRSQLHHKQQQVLIHKLKKILIEQEQSYQRRLNISKKYINRLQNQQEILKKQLLYANHNIRQYQQQFEFLKNIEVFQCWKCLQKINDGLLNHMKVCCGPLKEQLEVKILSVFKISSKTHFILEIKVIPTRYRKWQITKKLSELKDLEKVFSARYNCLQKVKNAKGKIKKNVSMEQHIENFLNMCCKHPQIQHDQIFKDFMAGVC